MGTILPRYEPACQAAVRHDLSIAPVSVDVRRLDLLRGDRRGAARAGVASRTITLSAMTASPASTPDATERSACRTPCEWQEEDAHESVAREDVRLPEQQEMGDPDDQEHRQTSDVSGNERPMIAVPSPELERQAQPEQEREHGGNFASAANLRSHMAARSGASSHIVRRPKPFGPLKSSMLTSRMPNRANPRSTSSAGMRSRDGVGSPVVEVSCISGVP